MFHNVTAYTIASRRESEREKENVVGGLDGEKVSPRAGVEVKSPLIVQLRVFSRVLNQFEALQCSLPAAE